jgi:hypothetical protein
MTAMRALTVVMLLFGLTVAGTGQTGSRDLAGVWMITETSGSFSTAAPPPMTPWATARFEANRPTIGPAASLDANDPTLACVPPGIPYIFAVPTPFEFVHAPRQIIQLFEYGHFVRRIYTDGRAHPPSLQETGSHEWLGHSIGRWEGSTLVVDTAGFNDETWLDRLGRPHSDRLRVVERITRTDDTLDYRITVHDEKAYTAAWEGRLLFTRRAGWEILEHTCVAKEDQEYVDYRTKAWTP